jgi:DNA-binding transcriptional LysR family regulator
VDAARRESIVPKHAHDIITPQQAVELVSEHVGVAILTKPTVRSLHADGVVVRPLSDTSLWFDTSVIMRAGDESRTNYLESNGSAILNRFIVFHLAQSDAWRPGMF